MVKRMIKIRKIRCTFNYTLVMLFQPSIETLPLDRLRKLQNKRLQWLVVNICQNIPFYKKLFDQHGINPSSVKSVEDLPRLPFTRKSDLRDNYPFGMFAVAKEDVIRIHCSSGTTGKPTVVGYTRNDLSRVIDNREK